MALTGWPFVNYASNFRLTSETRNAGRISLSVPRPKYTFLVEFGINEFVFSNGSALTNLDQMQSSGRLLTQLKSIDHPQWSMEFETKRSYNKYIKIPTKIEHKPITMTFHDDSSSVVMALIKEYLNFYHHTGDIGHTKLSFSDSLNEQNANIEYQSGNNLIDVGFDDSQRSLMNRRFSLGMRLKTNPRRSFFNEIAIYDFGMEPDSVNIFYLYRPVIADYSHANLDFEDRTTKNEVTFTIEYEGQYTVLGINRSTLGDTINSVLGNYPSGEDSKSSGHAKPIDNTKNEVPFHSDEISSTSPNNSSNGGTARSTNIGNLSDDQLIKLSDEEINNITNRENLSRLIQLKQNRILTINTELNRYSQIIRFGGTLTPNQQLLQSKYIQSRLNTIRDIDIATNRLNYLNRIINSDTSSAVTNTTNVLI